VTVVSRIVTIISRFLHNDTELTKVGVQLEQNLDSELQVYPLFYPNLN